MLINKPLLSITIPTYNRAGYLQKCLEHLLPQVQPYYDKIDLLISDNCSTDNTKEIVQKFQSEGNPIEYIVNDKNLGIDGNIEQCFSLAKGKYVWIFSDDDIILPNTFKEIIKILQEENYGNIYLSNYWYRKSYQNTINSNQQKKFKSIVYSDVQKYLKKVNYWTTFCSGNITNKSMLPASFDSKRYLGTNLTLVYWILSASILSKKNLYVDTVCLACKAGNSGGYAVFKTFASDLRKIYKEVGFEYNLSTGYIDFLDKKLLCEFLPIFIIEFKKGEKYNFTQENPMTILRQEYRSNIFFWIVNFPLFYLPPKVDSAYYRFFVLLFKSVGLL